MKLAFLIYRRESQSLLSLQSILLSSVTEILLSLTALFRNRSSNRYLTSPFSVSVSSCISFPGVSLSLSLFLYNFLVKVLAVEYCTGYVDDNGQWRKGFYCPKKEDGGSFEKSKDIYCCGSHTLKYCCERKEGFTATPTGFFVR